MSALASALLAELSETDLDRLAELLAPRIADRLSQSENADVWLRGADRIGEYIAAPRSRVYALASARRIPIERDGSALIARKSALDAWLRAGGGKRP
jgi:hypothetical protein